ncbi:MAG TPA: squalene synthase HpnC [Planctomycetaceae bacterium]|nr:squalene synthase HpnC [Planctomycetaceae bacterium]
MNWDFRYELERWGPDTNSARALAVEDARDYCRQVARTHYENFPVVTFWLPRELHQHFFNVYAFCRWSDDLSDEVEGAERSLWLFEWWRGELDACFRAQPRHPVFVALRETVQQFEIPPQPFEDLISAFEQDQTVSRYETFEQLQDYCRRSADPVGRLVLYLMRQANETNFRESDSICTGLQLANFWQDVARDFEIGRVYLPAEDRRRFDYTDDVLAQKASTPEFRELLKFEVERARDFLNAGWPLVDRLPGKYQMDIELFIRGGLCILDKVERLDFAVWEQRPKVGKQDLIGLLLKAFFRRWGRTIGLVRPAPGAKPKSIRREVTS